MIDDKVGYKKPPVKSRFKPGVSGNPKGRPKRAALSTAEIIGGALNGEASYREGGKIKSAPRRELTIRALVQRALQGDIDAAASLLDLWIRAEANRAGKIEEIHVDDWLPEFAGQTADHKTLELAEQSDDFNEELSQGVAGKRPQL